MRSDYYYESKKEKLKKKKKTLMNVNKFTGNYNRVFINNN